MIEQIAAGPVRQGCGRPGHRLRDDQGPRPHAPRHGVHACSTATRSPPIRRSIDEIRAISLRPGDEGRSRSTSTRERPALGAVADALGVAKLHVVETGGDRYQQEREQWDDGNNVVALEPGVVVAYERNTYTIAKMREAGVEVDRDRGLRARQGSRRRPLHDLSDPAGPDLSEERPWMTGSRRVASARARHRGRGDRRVDRCSPGGRVDHGDQPDARIIIDRGRLADRRTTAGDRGGHRGDQPDGNPGPASRSVASRCRPPTRSCSS